MTKEEYKQDPNFMPPNTIALPDDIDLKKFIQDVYELSAPQGLGHMHYDPKPLSDEEAEQVLERFKDRKDIVFTLDYLNGRACKITVWRNEAGTLYIADNWFDHKKAEFYRLLQRSKVKGIKLERDIVAEERIDEARNRNPFATTAGEEL